MSKRRRSGPRPPDAGFWGDADAGPGERALALIRPTPDPAALPRSLGDPPLQVRPGVADAHLAAVYEEAVRAATALAAVNGLLAPADDE
ncbi:MAG TPA: hypothetical protein VKU91_08450 [Acidimicrobiales bacterium]|nr:hypothetical protein [Acidimicrobiales bacterium]